MFLLSLLAVRATHAEEKCLSNDCPVQVNTLLQSNQQGIHKRGLDEEHLDGGDDDGEMGDEEEEEDTIDGTLGKGKCKGSCGTSKKKCKKKSCRGCAQCEAPPPPPSLPLPPSPPPPPWHGGGWPSNANALANECADAECTKELKGSKGCDYYKGAGYCEKAVKAVERRKSDDAQYDDYYYYDSSSVRVAYTYCRATCGLCELGPEKDVVSSRRLRSNLDGQCVQYDGSQLSVAECNDSPGQLWSTTNVGPKVGAQFIHLASDADGKQVLTGKGADYKFGNCGGDGCPMSMKQNKGACFQQWFFYNGQLRSEMQKGYGNSANLVYSMKGNDDCMQVMDDRTLRFRQCTLNDYNQGFYFE